MKHLSWFLLLSTLTLVIMHGCGFHMRGKLALPAQLSHTYIVGLPDYSDFGADLRRQLRANGVTPMDEPNEATATLRIKTKKSGKRVLAVNRKGKVLEYELYTRVLFEVKDADNGILLKDQTINLTRDYIFDENDVLGKAEEERLILKDMQGDLVRLMIYRLQTINKG